MSICVRRMRGSSARLELDGTATVRICAEARDLLLDLLGASRGVRVDLSQAASADVAFAQLVVSARKGFEAAGLTFEVVDPGRILELAIPCGGDAGVRPID